MMAHMGQFPQDGNWLWVIAGQTKLNQSQKQNQKTNHTKLKSEVILANLKDTYIIMEQNQAIKKGHEIS